MKKLYLFIYTIIYLIISPSKSLCESWLDKWQNCTVALGVIDTVEFISSNNTINKKAIFKVIGSGAIFYVKLDTIVIPTLVTAKHVFYKPSDNWQPDSIRIRFSWFENKPIDEYFGINLLLYQNNHKKWFAHPDSAVDLACYPLLLGNEIGTKKIPILPYNLFATKEDIFQGASILVFGYPGSVGMEFWTKALLRDGIISWTAPTNPDSNKILIDSNVFPGNSGGPVFLRPTGMDKNGNFVLGNKVKFLGIVSEGRLNPWPIKANGINEIRMGPQRKIIYSLESMGIGVIEPASRVRQLLSEFNKIIK